jgi:LPS-assembly protein
MQPGPQQVCYFCRLRPFTERPLTFINTKLRACHEKSSSIRYIFVLTLLGTLALTAAPIQDSPGANGAGDDADAAQTSTTSKPQTPKEAPPAVPLKSLEKGEWNFVSLTTEFEGKVRKLHGNPAEMEDFQMLIRADDIEYNEETKDVHAKGHVYFHDFAQNEKIWCDELEYHTERDDLHGKFYNVIGEAQRRIVTRPGVLTVNAPFHYEGEWAERVGEKYLLYNGWVTNCTLPNPWWRFRGPRFEIIPHKSAKGYHSTYVLRNIPLFWFPYFFYPLQKEPRKSGFLLPEISNSSRFGFTVGAGYYWAISRSYDATYRFLDYTSRAYSHHLDVRGKPSEHSDFDVILYGVQDRGSGGPNPVTYSGLSAYVVGKADLGDGWILRGSLNYITSFNFRQFWSQSIAEQTGSEIHSSAFLEKDWSTFTVDLAVMRLQNFENVEQQITNPVTGKTETVTDAVNIRKLPELDLSSRDHPIWNHIPLWFSFDSSAGLLYREEPFFNSDNTQVVANFQTSAFTDRVHLAPHLTSVLHIGDFSLVPSIGFDETFYSESQQPYQSYYRALGTDLVRSARDFSLDLIFPSFARVFPKKTIFGDKLKHVIEPRATYRYVTGVGSDFNRFIRFDETDLLANTSELELSLTNRVYAKRGDSVQEIFTWEIAQKRYFDPTFGGALIDGQRNVFAATVDLSGYAFLVGPRGYSPVVSTIRANPFGGLSFQWQSDYDPRLKAIVNSTLSADYRWKRYFISAGNSEVHSNPTNDPLLTPNMNQFWGRIGFGDPNHKGWNAAADMHYDYRADQLMWATVQVTYNTDCCGLSVQFRRIHSGLRDDSTYAASFSIANIGSFGSLKKQDRLF